MPPHFAVTDLFPLSQSKKGPRSFQVCHGLKLQSLLLVLIENFPIQKTLSLIRTDHCYCFWSCLARAISCFQSREEENNIPRVAQATSLGVHRRRKNLSLVHCLLVTALPRWAGTEIAVFQPALRLCYWMTVFFLGFFFGVKSHAYILYLSLT